MTDAVYEGDDLRAPYAAPRAAPAHGAAHAVHAVLSAFPVALFSLALVMDIAYFNSGNFQWVNFSVWLIVAGLVMGGLGALAGIVGWFVERHRGGVRRGTGWHLLLGIAALLVALVNAFVHSRDGWVAVVPEGLILSVVTVVLLLFGGIAAGVAARHGAVPSEAAARDYDDDPVEVRS